MMTFCVGMKVKEGLVGIADTRVTTGVEQITARKITVIEREQHAMFIMTSGLRSARDKALTYFQETLEEKDVTFNKLYKAVNAFAEQVRRVSSEDREALIEAGYAFNLHCIIGGQLENDAEHKLYLLYPQGNWVEVAESTPYYTIGESSYGKPLLDRVLSYNSNLEMALKAGYLAFDATRISATDVNFPMDVVLYRAGTYKVAQCRYEADKLRPISRWWQRRMVKSVQELPDNWMKSAIGALNNIENSKG